MLIDLTRKPLNLVPHESPGHLIVRTFQTPDVTGVITHRAGRDPKLKALDPGATLKKGSVVCMETRLPPVGRFTLDHEPPDPKGPVILPDPFEVATIYRDPLTGAQGNWRLSIQLQQKPGNLWLVSLNQIEHERVTMLVSVEVSDLLTFGGLKVAYPLQRLMAATATKGGPANAWDWLREDNDDAE